MKAKRIAADANFALDVTAGGSLPLSALAVLRERFPGSPVIVPPTTLHELVWLAEGANDPKTRRLALQALRSFGAKDSPWQPVPVLPEGVAAVDELAAGIHRRTGVPITEHDDA